MRKRCDWPGCENKPEVEVRHLGEVLDLCKPHAMPEGSKEPVEGK